MLSPIADVKMPANRQPEERAGHQRLPAAAIGPANNIPPQVALFKAAHYVVNYLELAEIVVEVVYDLLADRRKFTFTSGDLVRSAFDISEQDILERWADVEPSTLSLMTPENAHTLGNTPKIWPALFDFLYFSIGDVGMTTLFLRWIHTAMTSALEDADFPVLYQFQLNLLDQWFLLPHEVGTGITFEQLLQLLQAVAAFRAIVDEVLNFSFEGLKFTQQVSGAVSIKIDGVVDITLPEDAADFLSWSLNGETYRISLHFDEIAMADGTEFALVVDNPTIKLHFGCTQWRVVDLYLLGRQDSSSGLISQIREIAFGSVLHTAQDSFAAAHAEREPQLTGEQCEGTVFAAPARIVEFHA